MLKIRLSRFGKKKHPIYRIIVSEKAKDTVGDYLELLGTYDPHLNKAEINAERTKYWISKGAQTSGTIHNLLVDKKIIEAEKIKVANIKKKKGDEKEAEAAKPATDAKTTEAPADKKVESPPKEEKEKEKPKEEKKEEEKKPEPAKEEAKPAEKKEEEKK